jgi:hypothetical protein
MVISHRLRKKRKTPEMEQWFDTREGEGWRKNAFGLRRS